MHSTGFCRLATVKYRAVQIDVNYHCFSPAVGQVVLVTMERKPRLLEITLWSSQGLCS